MSSVNNPRHNLKLFMDRFEEIENDFRNNRVEIGCEKIEQFLEKIDGANIVLTEPELKQKLVDFKIKYIISGKVKDHPKITEFFKSINPNFLSDKPILDQNSHTLLVANISDFLTVEDLTRLEMTNKSNKMQQVLGMNKVLKMNDGISGEALGFTTEASWFNFLQEYGKDIIRLNFSGLDSPNVIQILDCCPNLKEIVANDCNLNEIKAYQIASHPNAQKITVLNVEGNPIGGYGAMSLMRLKEVEHLNFSNCRIGQGADFEAPDLQGIERMTKLKSLIAYNNEISTEGIDSIAKLEKLEKLNLSGSRLEDHSVQSIAENLKQLVYLDLSSCGINSLGIRSIGKMKTLKHLDLSGTYMRLEDVTAIAKIKGLKSLNLSGCGLNNETIKPIVIELKGLKSLGLERNKIKKEGASDIATIKGLEHLNMAFNEIGDEGAKIILKMENLRYVDISNSSVSSDEMKTIASMPNIQNLDAIRAKGGSKAVRDVLKREGWR